jgi:hypothetical protein
MFTHEGQRDTCDEFLENREVTTRLQKTHASGERPLYYRGTNHSVHCETMTSSAVVSRTGQLSEGCMEESPIKGGFQQSARAINCRSVKEGDDSLNERAPCSRLLELTPLEKPIQI